MRPRPPNGTGTPTPRTNAINGMKSCVHVQSASGSELPATLTFDFPSRAFPLAGVLTFVATMTLCVSCVLNLDHDIGGISWPYISDTGKQPPESGIIAFGFTLTAVLIAAVVTLNYGKIKRDIELCEHILKQPVGGRKRNIAAVVSGLCAVPFLGLLASFDTRQTAELHLLFVLIYFPGTLIHVFVNTSTYASVLQSLERALHPTHRTLVQFRTSTAVKRILSWLLLFFTVLYLPVGMALVTDWYHYDRDAVVHTFRAVCQHLAVLCIVLYHGSAWWDFGDLRMSVLQA